MPGCAWRWSTQVWTSSMSKHSKMVAAYLKMFWGKLHYLFFPPCTTCIQDFKWLTGTSSHPISWSTPRERWRCPTLTPAIKWFAWTKGLMLSSSCTRRRSLEPGEESGRPSIAITAPWTRLPGQSSTCGDHTLYQRDSGLFLYLNIKYIMLPCDIFLLLSKIWNFSLFFVCSVLVV